LTIKRKRESARWVYREGAEEDLKRQMCGM
jgi:hypothetical protein